MQLHPHISAPTCSRMLPFSFSCRHVRHPRCVRFEQEFMLVSTGLRREAEAT